MQTIGRDATHPTSLSAISPSANYDAGCACVYFVQDSSTLVTATALNYPNWSPDSKYAYFEDIGADGPEIDGVAFDTHKKERVASLKGIVRVNMPDSDAP